MIITFLAIAILVIGIIGILLMGSECKIVKKISYDTEQFISELSAFLIFAGIISTVFTVVIIICIHSGTDVKIQNNKIHQESLEKRVEIACSEYEDVSKSQVIADVAEWNKKVISDKYWSQNVWTNWFYNSKVVDEESIIEY